jgi:hypothetical protein
MTAITLAEAMRDPELLGKPFAAPSFWPWHAVAKIISGERLDEREAALFRSQTGRATLPGGPVSRLFMLAGRRGGKDRFMSSVAVHRAALAADWRSILSPGEQAVVILLGADKKQAAIMRRYCLGLLEAPLLADEVERETGEVIEFRNGAALEIATNNSSTIRGRSAIAVLGSESCFWRTDEASAHSDEEVVAAAEPAMAMIPDGGFMMLASSPYRKRGLMHRMWKQLHGNDAADDICWVAPSTVMNPALPAKIVDAAMARDPARARSEFYAAWRDDIADFIPADIIETATDFGVVEREPVAGVRYVAYCDAAGGTGSDSFTVAIGHKESGTGRVVLDALRERRPRFVPAEVTAEFAALLKQYRCTEVRGDRYAAGYAADEWTRCGIKYVPSERTTSENYLAGLPLLLNGRGRLVDSHRLRSQLGGLERRVHPGGRESIDHAPGQHDDLCASAIGALVLAATHSTYTLDNIRGPEDPKQPNYATRRLYAAMRGPLGTW